MATGDEPCQSLMMTGQSHRKRCSVSYLPLPARKPPARVLPEWESPPPATHGEFKLVEWQATYLVLRLADENAHLLHQEPLETEGERGYLPES